VLSNWGKRVYMRLKGAVVAVVFGGHRKRPERKRPRRTYKNGPP
jgi:hypothetical protein